MINYDSLTLKAQLQEIEPILTSGRIQKIQQPSRTQLLLSLRSGGKNHKLYISTDPKYPHVALLTDQGEEYRDIEIPTKPPMFCMLLRKHMEGAKIRAANQPEYERILEIYFDSYNELGARVPLVLACELMGKYSNIILYNYDNNVIVGCAHNVSAEKSREREISGGMPYIYPPKPKKMDLLKISDSEFYDMAKAIPNPMNIWLNNTFNYISLALATELCNVTEIEVTPDKITAISKEKIISLYNLAVKTLKLENINPSISTDKKTFSLIGLDPNIEWERVNSVNTMTDIYFGYQIYLDKFSRLKTNLLNAAKKELKKQKEKCLQHQKTLDSITKAEKYRQYADIIMANLHKIRHGAESVELENFFDNNEHIVIQLDSSLSPNANAQRYYKLYNKAKTAAKVSEELLSKINKEIAYLESVVESINQADSITDLKQIKDELISENLIKTENKKTKISEKAHKEKISLTQYTSSDGYKIYIGKNNKQNEFLISKIASPNDIWLHTQNMSGSHVLIKIPHEEKEIPEPTLHEAANLAAYYSSGKDSSNVPVIYTKRKFLKKPPGSKPGYVTYSNEKTLFVNPDVTLITKLS